MFVEVRSRSRNSHGAAVASISSAKRRRIISAARIYASRHALGDRPLRFDTIALDGAGAEATFRHDRGAFTVTDV